MGSRRSPAQEEQNEQHRQTAIRTPLLRTLPQKALPVFWMGSSQLASTMWTRRKAAGAWRSHPAEAAGRRETRSRGERSSPLPTYKGFLQSIPQGKKVNSTEVATRDCFSTGQAGLQRVNIRAFAKVALGGGKGKVHRRRPTQPRSRGQPSVLAVSFLRIFCSRAQKQRGRAVCHLGGGGALS